MNPPPTVVHAAADLRREALLAEAASDRRTTPSRASAGGSGVRHSVGRVIACATAVVSRIVDEFEPTPGLAASDSGRMEPQTRV
jgi:hypothetical protein